MNPSAAYDVIVYGSTGYTGRLVAKYLNRTYGLDGNVKWAMAGRSKEKLAAVRDEIGAPAETPFVIADASHPDSLNGMVDRAKCIISTVGPYTQYGSPLVEACIEAGTDYVDLCGEPLWMHEMITKHGEAANASSARIVFSCGFDSIPTDLGVQFLQAEAKKKFGHTLPRVRGRVRKMQGTFSGGTAASMKATMGAVFQNHELKDVLFNPFALCEGYQGPKQPSGSRPMEDEVLGQWVAPFIMATINTKNIHRSNYLLSHPYGDDLVYDEMMLTGHGEKGEAAAKHIASAGMGKDAEKKPGEGPTKEERENGFYDFLIHGSDDKGIVMEVGVTGDKDPGYGSTSKMLAESAICLVTEKQDTAGGIWTPASAMGAALRDRLIAKAGLTFEVEK